MNYLKTKISFTIALLFSIVQMVMAQDPAKEDSDSVVVATVDNAQIVDVQPVDSAFVREVEALLELHSDSVLQSLMRQIEEDMGIDEAWRKQRVAEEMKMDWTGWTMMVKGAVHTWTQNRFHNESVLYQPRHFGKEDYAVALTPLAATWALKTLGVPSKSSWKRMIMANSMALAMHVGVTQGLKHTVSEMRPNGEDDNSFPSGHTSLAFMSATILSREYGHLSPWVSIGGYGCASATQFLRMRHNNHWINDTFVGAGIGMLSANLAYFLTDKILGKEEIVTVEDRMKYHARLMAMINNPSGIRFMMGTEWGSKTVKMEDLEIIDMLGNEAVEMKVSTPYNVGVEGSWFLNPVFAVEGLVSMSTAHARLDITPKGGASVISGGKSMSMYHADMAAKFSLPGRRFRERISYRVLAGVRHSQSLTLDECVYSADGSVMERVPMARIPGQTRFEIGAGMSADILSTRKHSAGFVIDYYHTFTNIMPDRLVVSGSWKAFF